MEDFKEVLVVYNERRRPIRFQASSNPLDEHKNLLSAVEIGFKDVMSTGFYLQKEDKKWNELIDVTSTVPVEDGETLFLYCEADSTAGGPPGMSLGTTSKVMSGQKKLAVIKL